MPRVAMLGRFQPVHLGHENAIRRAQQYGDVFIGIYRVPQSFYNPYRPEDVEEMLHNAVPEITTFFFNPTYSPLSFIDQMEKGAGTRKFYTRSLRSAMLMDFLGFEVAYEARDKFRAFDIRESLMSGTNDWKSFVNPKNLEIIETASNRQLAKPRIFSFGLMQDLYKHGFGL
ncbi:MAG: adenylyltransferase/cytidyltransferase family protein [Candidatus Aenigmarchaeota archaeon]|nr:adenylyltransferase/cytidyltransferase family protein [Candidatus Aenigmarchaeota archaeon]